MSNVSVFKLGEELLDVVKLLRKCAGSRVQRKEAPSPSSVNKGASGEASLKCNTCGVGYGGKAEFDSVAEARSHFKSDWHRHNIRRKLKERPSLKEEDFERIIEQENEISSISGSDLSDGDDTLENMQGISGPMVSFISQGKEFSIWQCTLLADSKTARGSDFISGLRKAAKMQKWAVILSRGGHFAAAVYECSAHQKGQPAFKAKLHKTLHRYVIRAKAGGRQSTKDASGKFAKSAGAQIRRHNEAALERDIQTTLSSWKSDLDTAEAIFYQLSSADRNTFFGGKQPLFSGADNRLRKITFTTRRPTFSELNRVTGVLLSASGFQSHSEDDVPKTSEPSTSITVVQPEQLNVNGAFEDANAASSSQEEELIEDSELHKAARENQADKVWDLLQSGQSPEVVDGKNRTPYQVANSKGTRNAFRRYRAEEPDKWNYDCARIPSALTEEMTQSQNEKKAKKKARQRARKKEKKECNPAPVEENAEAESDDEIERLVAEVTRETERINQVRGSRRRGSSRKVGGQSTQQDADQRRELLAAAAEQRLNALKQASQNSKLW